MTPKVRPLFLFLIISLLYPAFAAAQSQGFPGREVYRSVPVWETEQLNQSFDKVIIIDVRSNYEFDTLHIKGAINIPLSNRTFPEDVAAINDPLKSIVFYCNGHTCYKSYKAQIRAAKAGITNTFSYDAGVFDWVSVYPERATLLGKSPVEKSKLISKDRLAEHSLDPKQFSAKITDSTVILDIREASQRGLMELFPYRQENIEMDDKEAMNKFLDKIKKSGQPLLVYDESGKQVRWLQYHLDEKGIKNYNFMKGGVKQYFKSLRGG